MARTSKNISNEYETILVTEKDINESDFIWGYARCSTNEDRQDISRQTRELKEKKCDRIVLEYIKGDRKDKAGFNYITNNLKQGHTIVALEVSRITRSTLQLCELIDKVKDFKVKLDINSLVVDCTRGELDPMTEGMVKMLGVVAEMERNITSQRIKSGLENAKAQGKKLGRKNISIEDIPQMFFKHYPQYKNKIINLTEYSNLCKVSRPTIYRWLNTYEKTV